VSRYYIGGASGSGKTTVSKIISKTLNIPHFTGSTVMMIAAGVSNRNDLSKIPEDQLNLLRETAFLETYEKNPDMILEGHFFLKKTDVNYFNQLILIDASTETILKYRLNDPTRERDLDLNLIKKDIEETRERAINASKKFNIPLKIINNEDEIYKLAELIQNAFLPVC
jgi:adenylate kinase